MGLKVRPEKVAPPGYVATPGRIVAIPDGPVNECFRRLRTSGK